MRLSEKVLEVCRQVAAEELTAETAVGQIRDLVERRLLDKMKKRIAELREQLENSEGVDVSQLEELLKQRKI